MKVTYLHPFWVLAGFACGWIVAYIQMKYGKK
jgi:hypothetical protein